MATERKTVSVERLRDAANTFLAFPTTTEEMAKGCIGLLETALMAANRYKGFNIRSGFPGAYVEGENHSGPTPFLGRYYY